MLFYSIVKIGILGILNPDDVPDSIWYGIASCRRPGEVFLTMVSIIGVFFACAMNIGDHLQIRLTVCSEIN